MAQWLRLILLAKKRRVWGLPMLSSFNDIYKACMAGWQHRERFPKSFSNRTLQVLHLIHSDLVGPMHASSVENSHYFVVFTDDYTCKSWIYFMTAKSENFQMFQKFKSRVENETRTRIHNLRTDRGGEYLSHEFRHFLTENGIHHQLTMARIPQQNKVAERRNHSLI